MTDERLQRLLQRAGDAGRVEAELRSWPVIQAAFVHERDARPRQRVRRPLLALAGAAALCAIVALAVSSPGAAVADWVRDHIIGRPGVKHSAPALTHVPGGGRLLVTAPAGVWVVSDDGSRRLLRGYAGATWSPRGLYIGAWRGHELFAVEPGGRVHWSLARPGLIRAAGWSPDGYRIAYLAGPSLRVVAGDGTGDRLLRAKVTPVAPAWRPHAPHLLAFAPRPRTVEVVATDAHALAWRHRVPQATRTLEWSADGRLLAVAGRTSVTVLDGAGGRIRRRIAAPRGFGVAGIAFAPTGKRLAVVLNSGGHRARALTFDLGRRRARPQPVFAGAGRFSRVQWSPDGRWLLISWPAANQWLFLRTARVSAVSAVRDIARQFDPAARTPRFPAVAGWCCQ